MKYRLYRTTDLDEVMQLFYDVVHSVNASDYSPEELDAMAPSDPNVYHWQKQLEKNHTLVVENEDGKLIGFGNIGATGFLDRLFVDDQYTRQGIATELVERLEKYAKMHDNEIIDTVSSITSVPFFKKMGYKVVSEQIDERRGERILRYNMEKKLS